jgi:hypothetical protein
MLGWSWWHGELPGLAQDRDKWRAVVNAAQPVASRVVLRSIESVTYSY